ncbi:hypothetical protein MLD38_011761 [Melastoma candidum]|uniref:Uncharacterized protein n=1 Tax=Melastoma candidum TaxID=119954 RepID=A0ACB9R740_9MYRT|nr:hypothetical protein MLD38_011761 [Melastoma candidum]
MGSGGGSWKILLLRIGDKCPEYNTTDPKEQIDTCYGAIRRELDHSGSDILPFLLQCAEQLPHKIPFYGTLVGLLNLENEEFVRKFVDGTQKSFQDALNSEDCNKTRCLLRFITVMMCSKVLQPSSLVVVFETLLSAAATTVDEEKGNPYWQAQADFYITCILSSLPWGGAELMEQVPEEIERVMVGIEAYMSIRKHVSNEGLSFVEDEDDQVLEEKDFLEDLWTRIQDLSSHGWKLNSVPKPHLSFEAQLVDGKSHDFVPVSCPAQPDLPSAQFVVERQKHDAELKYPQRIRRLNIFPANKTEDLQPIDRFVMEEYLLDVLFYLNGCRKECAFYMVGLPVPFRYEYIMAETIFSQLLLLPHPPFKPLYYTLVIIDLCKALPGAFPAVVAGAVRVLFEKIAIMDMECRTRLILWFAHHLSNFQFIWPWDEWAYVMDLPKWAPQRVFVQEVLDREVRLSYWEKVKQSIDIAPALEALLPPKGGPNFKYDGTEGTDQSDEQRLSSELKKMVKGRQTAAEVISWIEESVLPGYGLQTTLSVIAQTLLDIGSKSFTHLITILERYGQVFVKLCGDEEKQVMLIEEVSSYWKNNTQMTAVAIDRMMGYRLISNFSILRWVFSPDNVERFHTSDRPWEILGNAVSKTFNRIADLRKEITSLKNSIVLAEESAVKAQAELETAESKLVLVDGKPTLGENPVRLKRLQAYADKAKEKEASVREIIVAKEALLRQALEENELLFLNLYGNFSSVLKDKLPEPSKAQTLWDLKSNQADKMAVDAEEPSTMDMDDLDEGGPKKSLSNGETNVAIYNVGEKEQWCLSTLGHLKAFSRQYASEIWPHVERLDAEVLTENAHPLVRKAFYSGLRRSRGY